MDTAADRFFKTLESKFLLNLPASSSLTRPNSFSAKLKAWLRLNMALDLDSFSYCTRSALKYNRRLILKMRKLLKQTRAEWYVINWKKRCSPSG
jgi:hypothetical protein